MIIYICQTIDGFIAKKNGDISYLDYHNESISNSTSIGIRDSYNNFIKNIDVTVSGYNTYEVIRNAGYENPYPNTKNFVITNKVLDAT